MNVPNTASALLAQLTSSATAPEPAAPSWPSWSTDGPNSDPLFYEPTDPQAEAIRRIVAALRETERQRQAERESRIRQIVRDHMLLRRLLKAPTPAELPPPPLCDRLPRPRCDYRGLMGGK